MKNLENRARNLFVRAQALRQAGTVAQISRGPELVEETGALLIELAARQDAAEAELAAALARLDALTPYFDDYDGAADLGERGGNDNV